MVNGLCKIQGRPRGGGSGAMRCVSLLLHVEFEHRGVHVDIVARLTRRFVVRHIEYQFAVDALHAVVEHLCAGDDRTVGPCCRLVASDDGQMSQSQVQLTGIDDVQGDESQLVSLRPFHVFAHHPLSCLPGV